MYGFRCRTLDKTSAIKSNSQCNGLQRVRVKNYVDHRYQICHIYRLLCIRISPNLIAICLIIYSLGIPKSCLYAGLGGDNLLNLTDLARIGDLSWTVFCSAATYDCPRQTPTTMTQIGDIRFTPALPLFL